MMQMRKTEFIDREGNAIDMIQAEFAMKIDDLVGDARRIAITGHTRPDGDCTGACLGLRRYLWDLDPSLTVDVYLEPVPAAYDMLEGFETVCLYTEGEYELCFVLDVSSRERLGKNATLLDHVSRVVCIDHHATSEGLGDQDFVVPEAAAACELLYDMMNKEHISLETAECLYLGIIHDTNVFKNSNTTRHTMEVAGALMAKGVDQTRIINDSFYVKTYLQNQLLGMALMKSLIFCDGRCIVSVISRKTMDFYQATHADLDGIVEQLRVTKGVECAIFLTELQFRQYKVSMRSNEAVDVSQVAAYFGGGGHVRAAGCTMEGSFYDVVNNLSEQIVKQLDEE